jgi:hypothetical protein
MFWMSDEYHSWAGFGKNIFVQNPRYFRHGMSIRSHIPVVIHALCDHGAPPCFGVFATAENISVYMEFFPVAVIPLLLYCELFNAGFTALNADFMPTCIQEEEMSRL